jgi:hypothetical protein
MISKCGLASLLPAPYIVPQLLLLLVQHRLEYLISETAREYNNLVPARSTILAALFQNSIIYIQEQIYKHV